MHSSQLVCVVVMTDSYTSRIFIFFIAVFVYLRLFFSLFSLCSLLCLMFEHACIDTCVVLMSTILSVCALLFSV